MGSENDRFFSWLPVKPREIDQWIPVDSSRECPLPCFIPTSKWKISQFYIQLQIGVPAQPIFFFQRADHPSTRLGSRKTEQQHRFRFKNDSNRFSAIETSDFFAANSKQRFSEKTKNFCARRIFAPVSWPDKSCNPQASPWGWGGRTSPSGTKKIIGWLQKIWRKPMAFD